jgi:hypothetical protein
MRSVVRTAVLALAFAAPASAGLTFKQVVSSSGEHGMNQTVRVSFDTGGARIEFLDSGNPMLPVGGYILMRPDDDAMILVNPKEKTYASFDLAALMGAMRPLMGGAEGGQPMIRSGGKPTIEKLLEEDGGAILGRPTKHVRYHTVTSVVMEIAPGMAMTTETDATEDTWVAEMPLDKKVLRALSSFGGAAIPEELADLVEAQKELNKGLPMKRVVKSTTRTTGTGLMAMMAKQANAAGDKPTTTTFEIVELLEEKVPASAFAIPAGYTETEILSPGMKMPDMNRRD